MGLHMRDFTKHTSARKCVPMAVKRAILTVGGSQSAVLEADADYRRIMILGVSYEGEMTGAGRVVVEARKAPMIWNPSGGSGRPAYSVGVCDGSDNNQDGVGYTEGTSFEEFQNVRHATGAAVVIGTTPIWPPGDFSLATRVAMKDVPLVRVRSNKNTAAVASGTITATGGGADTETVTVGDGTSTWPFTLKTALSAKGTANEILVASTAAELADRIRRAINKGPGYGNTYNRNTASELPRNKLYAEWAGTAVVTIRPYVAGTAGNAYTLAEASASLAVSGATLTGGVNGDLSDDATNFIAVHIDYATFEVVDRSDLQH